MGTNLEFDNDYTTVEELMLEFEHGQLSDSRATDGDGSLRTSGQERNQHNSIQPVLRVGENARGPVHGSLYPQSVMSREYTYVIRIPKEITSADVNVCMFNVIHALPPLAS